MKTDQFQAIDTFIEEKWNTMPGYERRSSSIAAGFPKDSDVSNLGWVYLSNKQKKTLLKYFKELYD